MGSLGSLSRGPIVVESSSLSVVVVGPRPSIVSVGALVV